jgi:small neutral amino acid transporter SnatA (MarC family)
MLIAGVAILVLFAVISISIRIQRDKVTSDALRGAVKMELYVCPLALPYVQGESSIEESGYQFTFHVASTVETGGYRRILCVEKMG